MIVLDLQTVSSLVIFSKGQIRSSSRFFLFSLQAGLIKQKMSVLSKDRKSILDYQVAS